MATTLCYSIGPPIARLVLIVISDSPYINIFLYHVGDLETAEDKYENAKKELEATLAELADV